MFVTSHLVWNCRKTHPGGQICLHQESLVGSVIQAAGTEEFDYGLKTGFPLEAAGALRVAEPSLGSIPNTPGAVSWP